MPLPIVLVHGLFGHLDDSIIVGAIGAEVVMCPTLIGYGTNGESSLTEWSLEDQARHVAAYIDRHAAVPVNLVGHSVGGAVSVVLADLFPHLVASLVLVEGNFTLNDAFWSSQIARKPLEEVDEILAGYCSDPDGWIAASVITVDDWTSRLAREWLAFQPASTIRMQARSVVEETGEPRYLERVRRIIRRGMPLHLIAGERSAPGWDVPDWVNAASSSRSIIPGAGHLMMVENPAAFGAAVRAACIHER